MRKGDHVHDMGDEWKTKLSKVAITAAGRWENANDTVV